MYRTAIESLHRWEQSPLRNPLILQGARQVGKTWLMKEFGRARGQDFIYLNLEGNRRMENLFAGDLEVGRIIAGIQLETGQRIVPGQTLLIFDEVQEVPRALTSLKYFQENQPGIPLLAAGSQLGIALHPGTSFPVGKVDFLSLPPMNFQEFLLALGRDRYLELLSNRQWEPLVVFRDVLISLLKQYLVVGGMPEAVAAFTARGDYAEVRTIQQNILRAYEQDFSKHAPNAAVPRIRLLWSSIPAQLAKEKRKFVYGRIQTGARAREYELAMTWLCDCGLIHRIMNVSKPAMPLYAYSNEGAFKLFMLDVGLLGALAGLDARAMLDGDRLFSEFCGALTEQYVAQQLMALGSSPPVSYWTSESGQAEVDFLIQLDGGIYPIEVKAAENLKAKSLKVYAERFQPRRAIRTSLANYRDEGWRVNIPLYTIGQLPAILGAGPAAPGAGETP